MRAIAPFAALAFALSVATAFANEAASDETAGKIAVVDESTLILEDGATFTISESVSIEGLEPGTEVTVSFEEQGGEIFATKIAPSN
jgi:Cu/Ag efflux protein CusF